MPNTTGAKKAHRASLKKRVFNIRRRTAMVSEVKNIKNLVKEGKQKEAQGKLPVAYKAIDKAAKRGLIKKNTAARKKSRLSLSIKKIS